jgi:hypothetical protein
VTTRRSRGEGGLHWDEQRQRWIATASLGIDGRGKRISKKASGRTKTEAKNKLRDILRDHEDGLVIAANHYTVGDAVRDWLSFGLTAAPTAPWRITRRSPKATSSPLSVPAGSVTSQLMTLIVGCGRNLARSARGRCGSCTRC